MNLSHNARKGLAIGLAASTVLMTAAVGFVPAAFAAPHADGCLVLSNGTVYMVSGGQLRGFPSADVFYSWGNGFGGVQQASAEDLALPMGPVLVYADGTLVKGPNDPLVYLVSNGQKLPFTSGTVFTGLGFKFSNIQSAPANTFADLPTGGNVDNATARHAAGVWVIDSTGTVWRMTATGRVGLPSMAVFNSWGKSFSTVVPANAADMALSVEGVASAKPSCGTSGNPQTGSVNVSLASDNPSSNTIVIGQSTADLLHVTFTGSGTVTQLTFQRTGVSSNSLLSNVYLYNGAQRITDGSAVSTTGQVTFSNASGLFTAPASISVRSDISSTGTAGQTVGLSFVSGTANGGSIGGSASGNLMSTASTTLATADFASSLNAPNTTTNVNAGSMNYTVWSDALTVSTNPVWLKSAMFKVVASASLDAVQNINLYVDGSSVASTSALQTINGSNYAVFSLSSPKSILVGSHTLEVRADIIKGSGRYVKFSLQNAADIMLTDSNYNVNVTPTVASSTFSARTAGELDIQQGFVATQVDPSFSSVTSIPGGATNVTIGKFTMTGYGEDTQVNTLGLSFGSTSGLTNGINNVTLFVNGGQVGSAQQVTGTVSSATPSFNLGSSLIVPAGGTVSLEVHADTIDHGNASISSGTIQVHLAQGSANGQGRQSQNTYNVPTAIADGPALTVGAGGFTVAKSAYANQTLSPNSTVQKIGEFVLQAGNNEPIQVSNLAVALVTSAGAALASTAANDAPGYTNMSNIKVSVNGGSPSTPQPSAQSFNFSQSFTIPQNGTATVAVWSDLGAQGSSKLFKVTLLPTARGTISNTTVTPSGATAGQVITLTAGSLSAPTFSTAQSDPSKFVASTTSTPGSSHNKYNLVGSSGAVTVSELKFAVKDSVAGATSSITVNGTSFPVITPAATTVAAYLSTLSSATTFTVASGAGSSIPVGSVLTIESEDMLVTAVSGDTLTVVRGQNGTSPATHADSTAVTVNGLAYVTGQNIAVPNGSGGTYVDAQANYSNIAATGGIASGTTSKVFLTYTKYSSGTSSTAAATATAIAANAMYLVGSRPNFSVPTGSGTLTGAEVEAFRLTVTPSSTGPIQLNTLVFSLATTTISVAQGTSSTRLAIGSTTVTGSTCTAAGVTGGATVTCALPSNYVLQAGIPVTFSLFVTTTGALGAAGASILTTSLAASSNQSWTDTQGGGSAVTTANTTYFDNFPTQTWSLHN